MLCDTITEILFFHGQKYERKRTVYTSVKKIFLSISFFWRKKNSGRKIYQIFPRKESPLVADFLHPMDYIINEIRKLDFEAKMFVIHRE